MSAKDSPLCFGAALPLYADVIVPRHIAKAFTYLVPTALTQTISIGQKVLVPFGRTILEGAVIALHTRAPKGIATANLKELHSLVNDSQDARLVPARLALSRAIAQHYVAPWGQCLRLLQSGDAHKRTSPLRYVATEPGRTRLTSETCPDHLRGMLARIAGRSRGILESTLLKSRDRDSRNTFETLKQLSWIATADSPVAESDAHTYMPAPASEKEDPEDRSPHALFAAELPEPDPLWINRITDCLKAEHPHKILLHAPWGHRVSRLIDALQRTYTTGNSAIILVGEIAKVHWLNGLLTDLTGLPITGLSSSGEARYRSVSQDRAPSVVIGTRSTVFAECRSVGLIWVEGEEDSAFKEPQEPRYHARDVAWIRAQTERALLVLASSHPSLESTFDPLAETHRVQPEPAHRPAIELVDLRQEPRGTLFGRRMVEGMRETMEDHAGIILFLNRKGYAHTLICRDCGWMPRCLTCAVSLGYWREAGKLACRYCGRGDRVPEGCPQCTAAHLDSIGDGTERVEAEARRLFPSAKIIRADGEKLRRTAAGRGVWEEVRSGSWDILIGTQAMFHREPLPRRGLVGILQADSGLHIPDFRAAERTYQQLDEAVGFARPASVGGRVIIQTRLPTHHAIQAVLSDDPQRFYSEELAARRLLNYPPTCHLAALSVSGKDPRTVEAAAAQWKQDLEESVREEHLLAVLGPVPTTGQRPTGSSRHQLIVKGMNRGFLCSHLRESVERLEHQYRKKKIKFIVDVDPVDMR